MLLRLVALLFLIIGNGCFKPNISTQVGDLYQAGDPRRDGAFTIFYMGVNLGAFFSPLVCGTLGQMVGWHWGFGAAGVGMLIGLVVYVFGQRYLAPDVRATRSTATRRRSRSPAFRRLRCAPPRRWRDRCRSAEVEGVGDRCHLDDE